MTATTKAPAELAASVLALIAGEELAGPPYLVRFDPADATTTVSISSEAGEAVVDRTASAAEAVGDEWAAQEITERARLLLVAATVIEQDVELIATRLPRALSKPITDCCAEAGVAIRPIQQTARDGPRRLGDDTTENDARGRLQVRRRSYGVVAAIIPWSAPLVLATAKVAPALLSGNTLVLKSSRIACWALTTMLRILADAFPARVLNIVQRDGDTGRALVTHPGVRRIAFISGGAGGASVVASAARRVVPVSLELETNLDGVVLRAPFGGVTPSGLGREFSSETVLEHSTAHVRHLPTHARTGSR
jgi:acyl-CoA reductase-like NAD-dependent aldehyde dehydrogenase